MEDNKSVKLGDKVVAVTKNGGVVIGILDSYRGYVSNTGQIKATYKIYVGTSSIILKSDDMGAIAPYEYVFPSTKNDNEWLLMSGAMCSTFLYVKIKEDR